MNLQLAAINPLELLVVPGQIDGRAGTNRAFGTKAQISADNDIDAVKAWLARVADKKTTFETYRKEAERLLLWCAIERAKPLSSLTHEDWLLYKEFIKQPRPAARWVSAEGRKYPRAHRAWRPFAGPLSATSQRQAAIILNALFSWLVNAGYLAGNPLTLSRNRKARGAPRVTRYLDDDIWSAVKETIEAMPRESPRQVEHYHRLRWLFSVLYVCGLRISELIGTTMGAFFAERDRDGDVRTHGGASPLSKLVRIAALPLFWRADSHAVTDGRRATHAIQRRHPCDYQVRVPGYRRTFAGTRGKFRGTRCTGRARISPLAASYSRFAYGEPGRGSAACAGQSRA